MSCDYKELLGFQKKLQKLESKDRTQFFESCVKELAARLLGLVIARTPVGDYPKSTGKKGGTLRRGWTAKTEKAAVNGSGDGEDARKYAYGLNVIKKGKNYSVEISNPVHYAIYVEYGHRVPNGGYTEGKKMLTFSEEELKASSSVILERKLKAMMEGAFNV